MTIVPSRSNPTADLGASLKLAQGLTRTKNLGNATITARPTVEQTIAFLKSADGPDEPTLLSAHRGFPNIGVPENSVPAIRSAVEDGMISVEIDIRLTKDGQVVILHDEGAGRVTNIADYHGHKDIYDVFTGRGYNPLVSSLSWADCLQHLYLKDHVGILTTQRITTLHTLLSAIHDEGMEVVVLLDIKGKSVMGPAYEIIRQHTNRRGVPALEWCLFKPSIQMCPTPSSLQDEGWYCEASSRGDILYWVPVFEPTISLPDGLTLLDVAKLWAAQPNTVALEVGLRWPNGPGSEIVEWAMNGGTKLRLGSYAALGDEWLLSHARCPPRDDELPLVVYEGHPVTTFDQIMKDESGEESHDYRSDLDLFKRLGFSWVIADRTTASLDMVDAQPALCARIVERYT